MIWLKNEIPIEVLHGTSRRERQQDAGYRFSKTAVIEAGYYWENIVFRSRVSLLCFVYRGCVLGIMNSGVKGRMAFGNTETSFLFQVLSPKGNAAGG